MSEQVRSTKQSEPYTRRLADLGALIYSKRQAEGLTLEQAAEQSGVSVPTLWRLENARIQTASSTSTTRTRVPGMRTMSAVTRWLGMSVDRFLEPSSDVNNAAAAIPTEENVPAVVEMHLRADKNLSPDAAEKLATMFRLAYEAFSSSTVRDEPDGQSSEGDDQTRPRPTRQRKDDRNA